MPGPRDTALRTSRSPSWHRVSSLRPVLPAAHRVTRHRVRGETWHVIEDPASGRYHRLNEPAYRFVVAFDGRRTVEEARDRVAATLGEEAPTEGEAVRIVAQMHEAGLLRSDEPSVVEPLIRRSKSRRTREVRGRLGGLLFVRLPIYNPDRLLNALSPWTSWLVSPIGLLLWLATVVAGVWHLAGNATGLVDGASSVLATPNLLLLYVTIAAIKLAHEAGHALILKALARRVGGVSVPSIGLMLLVFLPFPYIDASGAWMLRSKWHRALVGMGGVLVELAIASVAAVVWTRTADGTTLNALAYNAVLAAGVSTLLFNLNPLLRYDGYHVLSDLTETPNLGQRAQAFAKATLQRVAFGVLPRDPVPDTRAERLAFLAYAVASWVYKIAIYATIGLFVLAQQPLLGAIVLAYAGFEFVLTPIGKALRYVATDEQLATRRSRAAFVTALAAGAVAALVGAVPLPRNTAFTGEALPATFTSVRAEADGVVLRVTPAGTAVEPGAPLVRTENPDIAHAIERLEAERERVELLRRRAMSEEPQTVAEAEARLKVIEQELAWQRDRAAALSVNAPNAGIWVSPDADRIVGAPVRAGDELGTLVAGDINTVRIDADPQQAALLARAAVIELRPLADPDRRETARYLRELTLPATRDTPERRVVELTADGIEGLLPGQRVRVRASDGHATLLARAIDAVLRVTQRGTPE